MRNARAGSIFAVWLAMLTQAHASLLSEAVNVITDPLKIGAGTENVKDSVERAQIIVSDLEKYGREEVDTINGDIITYLSKLDSIVDKALNTEGVIIETAINTAAANVLNIETDVFADANKLVQCVGVVSEQTIKDSLSDALNRIGASKPRFVLFGIEIGHVAITPQDIDSPITGYRQLKALYEQKLNNASDETDASVFLTAFGEMERQSQNAQCFYRDDNTLNPALRLDYYEYRRQGQVWVGWAHL